MLHVQTFARELTAADDEDARLHGYATAEHGYGFLVRHSVEAWALCTDAGRVLAMCGVVRGSGMFWVHTVEAFKCVGLGALRLVRRLVCQLVERHGQLLLDVDTENQALVRMADWLGFKTRGVIEKHGRRYHSSYLKGAMQ